MASNLLQHRGTATVWERANRRACDSERFLIAVVAATLFFAGLRRRSPAGLLSAIAGAGLAWWGASRDDERRASRERLRGLLSRDHRTDPVIEASEESFPASDAPPWTTGGSDTTRRASHRLH